jgi:hypothetical protein
MVLYSMTSSSGEALEGRENTRSVRNSRKKRTKSPSFDQAGARLGQIDLHEQQKQL